MNGCSPLCSRFQCICCGSWRRNETSTTDINNRKQSLNGDWNQDIVVLPHKLTYNRRPPVNYALGPFIHASIASFKQYLWHRNKCASLTTFEVRAFFQRKSNDVKHDPMITLLPKRTDVKTEVSRQLLGLMWASRQVLWRVIFPKARYFVGGTFARVAFVRGWYSPLVVSIVCVLLPSARNAYRYRYLYLYLWCCCMMHCENGETLVKNEQKYRWRASTRLDYTVSYFIIRILIYY